MALPKKILGRTGLEVTQLGYGSMELRGPKIWKGRDCADQQAETILNAVLDEGINFIDTANDYGMSEMHIGRCIAGRKSEFVLATKVGCFVVYGENNKYGTMHVWTNDNVYRGTGESLLKLQLDQVDILQLHNPSREAVEEGGLLETLQELKDKGACKFIGVSTTTPNMEEFIKWDVFDVFQVPYSALQRTHENLITKAGEAGAGIIIRGGVAQGEPGEGRGGQNAWANWEKANLDELLEEDQSRTAFMLRFTLSHPYCHTTIVGTLNPEHLKQNVQAACQGPLPADVYEEAKQRLADAGEVPLEY